MTKSNSISQPILLALAFVLTLSGGSPSFAEVTSDTETQILIADPVLKADRFRPWILTGHYSLLDLVVPNKLGIAVEFRDDGAGLNVERDAAQGREVLEALLDGFDGDGDGQGTSSQ